MKVNCFYDYFSPIKIYIANVYSLITNDYVLGISSFIVASAGTFLTDFLEVDYFGVSKLLLSLVILTVLIDAAFGIKKSLMIGNSVYVNAMKYPPESTQRRRLMNVYESKRFSSSQLQFTFFKCFTLLGYLFFAKTLLGDGDVNLLSEPTLFDSALNFTAEIIIKAPLTIFWYYDFKSIGKNTEFIYGKKAPIFKIVEMIFEPRIFKFLRAEERAEERAKDREEEIENEIPKNYKDNDNDQDLGNFTRQ